jgi:sugar phosphate isomerase/epimerase
MSKIYVGLNAEFSRSSDKPFEWAVEKAAAMGYKYFEPMVHYGRELMSEAGYFHTVSMFDDPFRIKEACDAAGLAISGLQSHGPLGRPDVHGEYIKLAIRVAPRYDRGRHTPKPHHPRSGSLSDYRAGSLYSSCASHSQT